MDRYCIGKDYTIKETIERIDAHHNRVAIVLNKEQKVIGVVSQGDIIRALCAGKSIYSRVESIVQPNFLYLNQIDMEKAYKIFKCRKITLLPILNENNNLIDVIILDTIYRYLEEKCKK